MGEEIVKLLSGLGHPRAGFGLARILMASRLSTQRSLAKRSTHCGGSKTATMAPSPQQFALKNLGPRIDPALFYPPGYQVCSLAGLDRFRFVLRIGRGKSAEASKQDCTAFNLRGSACRISGGHLLGAAPGSAK